MAVPGPFDGQVALPGRSNPTHRVRHHKIKQQMSVSPCSLGMQTLPGKVFSEVSGNDGVIHLAERKHLL